jgi:hypothetical protein
LNTTIQSFSYSHLTPMLIFEFVPEKNNNNSKVKHV